MIRITLDAELSKYFHYSHPLMSTLARLEQEKKLQLLTIENQMKSMDRVNRKNYDRIRFACFPEKEDVEMTTLDHSNVCLLANHLDKKGDFFVTSNMGAFVRAFKEDELGKMGIRVLTGPIPAFFLCAGIVFALFYPLSRERHAEVRREIAERKATQSKETV